ncbi:MAG: hypothetical protein M1281_12370, partial [Chloroflexi bacterium]|nr:hypothetical protein [Chloroflexota bacterium]
MMTLPLPASPEEVRVLLEQRFGDPGSEAMSPYDRVKTALRLRPPDRVPFDFWGVPETIENLIQYLHARDEEEMLELLGVDCRMAEPDYIGPEPERLPDGTFYGVWGSHRRKVRNEYSTYEEYASFPLAAMHTRGEVEAWPKWPRTGYWDWAGLPGKIRALNQKTRYHIRYQVGGIFESAWGLYGLDRFLTDLATNPEVPCAIMDCYTDLFIENVRSLMSAAGGMIDMVYTYDDVAIQNGLMMSPKMWR